MANTKHRARTLLGALALLLALGGAAAAEGQSREQASPQVGCFRGRPLPDCRSFWIVEIQGSVPLVQSTRRITLSGGPTVESETVESVVEWNAGHMINLSDRYAVGALLTVGSGGADPLVGMKLRGRRWLHRDVGLEFETGPTRTYDGEERWLGMDGLASALRLNIRDQGTFYVRWDLRSVRERRLDNTGYYDPGGTQHALSVGASAGSVPALVATGGLAVIYAVLLGVYLGDS